MDLENGLVRSWKEYTPAGVSDSSPVSPIDIADVVNGGLVAESWEWSFSCCGTTLCAGCTA